MKNIITLFFAACLLTSHIYGQCLNFASLSHSPNTCIPGDTLRISDGTRAKQIIWQNGSSVVSSLSTYRGRTVVGDSLGSNSIIYWPQGIFVDHAGNVYVAEYQKYWVKKWAPGATTGVIVAGGNGYGSAANQIGNALGVFVDSLGNVYVSDPGNNRVQKWAPGATSGVTVAGGNGAGSSANQLNYPYGIYVDHSGTVYVADFYNYRVQKWPAGSVSGLTVAGGNGSGTAANQLASPETVSVDNAGNVYVGDNTRVQKWAPGATVGVTVAGSNTAGSAQNQLNGALCIALDNSGNLFVNDGSNKRIQKFPAGSTAGSNGVTVMSYDTVGIASYRLNNPTFIYVDSADNVYIADWQNNRVQEWGPPLSTTYVPTAPGTYTAIVTNDSCTVTTNAIIITSTLAPSASVTDTRNFFCNGTVNTADTFTAIPANGGLNPSYQWYKNGAAVGTNSNVYTTASSANGDSVWVVVTSSLTCASPVSGTSNKIHITIGAAFAPSVSISATSTVLCTGNTRDTFSANITNGGFTPTYRWYKNGAAVSTASTYTPATLNNNDSIWLVITSGLTCASPTTATSNKIHISVTATATPSVTISSSGSSPCASINDSLTAVTVDGGSTPSYQWYMNGNLVGTSQVYVNSLGQPQYTVTDSFWVILTSSAACVTTTTVRSSVLHKSYSGVEVFTMAQSGAFCTGTDTLTVSGMVNGATQITWLRNDTPVYTINATGATTVAGQANCASGSGAAYLEYPFHGMFIDKHGNIYIADTYNYRVQKWAPGATTGVTVAGGNGQGLAANQLYSPTYVFVDASGNVYVTDENRVQKWAPGATTGTTVAGLASGINGGSPNTYLYYPTGLYVDASSNVYVADGMGRVTKWAPGATTCTTVAGGNGVGENSNQLYTPGQIWIDASNNIYIADNTCVLKWPMGATSGYIFAGYSRGGYLGPTNDVSLVNGFCFDLSGNMYIANSYITGNTVIKIPPTGGYIGTTVAGWGYLPGTNANEFNNPGAVYVDSFNNIYILDNGNSRVQKWGQPSIYSRYGPTVPGTYTALVTVGSCVDTTNTVVVSAQAGVTITAQSSSLCSSSVADTFTASTTTGGTSPSYQWYKNGVAVGTNSSTYGGNMANGDSVWVVLTSNLVCTSPNTGMSNKIGISVTTANVSATLSNHGGLCAGGDTLTATLTGNGASIAWQQNGTTLSTVQDTGVTIAGITGSSGSAANQLSFPTGVWEDGAGNIYVLDGSNSRVQKYPAGTNSSVNGVTVAGGNSYGSALNQLYNPIGLFVTSSGDVYVSDSYNNRVLKFPAGSTSATNGTVVAGGNGAGAMADQLNNPVGVFVDASGNVYVSDASNNRVQEWAPGATSGLTIAGGNGSGSAANQLSSPRNIFVDASGNVYIADYNNNRIQEWAPGAISGVTVAGAATGGTSLYNPIGVFKDAAGNLYVSNEYSYKVVKFLSGSVNGTTVAGGNGAGSSSSQLYLPYGIYVETGGNILIADWENMRVQRWSQPAGIKNTYLPTLPGTYTAVVTGTNGCRVTTNPISIGVLPTVSITASATVFCSGLRPDTFTATPANGIAAPSYQWYKSGVPVGTNSVIYVASAFANNDSVWVVMTDSACGGTDIVTSNKIGLVVSGYIQPTVSLNVSQTSFCSASGSYSGRDTFYAAPYDAGPVPKFFWYHDRTLVGYSGSSVPQFQDNDTYHNGDSIRVMMISDAQCVANDTAYSAFVIISVATGVSPSVTVSATYSGVCAGGTDTFTATSANGSANPVYQWYKNGVAVGTNSPRYVSSTLMPNDSVWVSVSDSNSCSGRVSLQSNKIILGSAATVTPSVSIYGSPGSSICLSSDVDTLSAYQIYPGSSPSFQWYKNGLPLGSNSDSLYLSHLNNNDSIWVVMTSNAQCATTSVVTSPKYHISVLSPVIPSVTVSASSASVCSSLPLDTFTATPSQGGISPSYQWYADGAAVGTNSAVYYAGGNGVDSVWVVMTTTAACASIPTATSNKVHVAMSQAVVPSISISASHTSFCSSGSTLDTFTAISANGGTTPVYQWYKNGVATGTNALVYIAPSLANNDSVWVVMTSSAACSTAPTATSGKIHISVASGLPSTVSVTASRSAVCNGGSTIDTFTATAINAGASPVYHWYDNGVASGTNSPIFAPTVHNGDQIYAIVTNSLSCASLASDTSNTIAVQNDAFVLYLGAMTTGPCPGSNAIFVTTGGGYPLSELIWYNGAWTDTVRPSTQNIGINIAGTPNSIGSGAAQLYSPQGICVKGSLMYVADYYNYRVQRFQIGINSGTTVAGGNGQGSAANQFNSPTDVCVDASTNLYVADPNNNRVQKWASGATTGTTVAGTGGYGSGANQLSSPQGVCIDASNTLYVSDAGNNRIQKFTSGSTNGVTVAGGNGAGNAANQLNSPNKIAVDNSGNIYICDGGNNRIQKWAPGATFGVTVGGGNGVGSAANQLHSPVGIALDPNGNIYVADQGNSRVQKFPAGSTSATNATTVASNAPGSSGYLLYNAFRQLSSVALDSAGDLLMSDQDRVLAHTSTPILDTLLLDTATGTYSARAVDVNGCVASTAGGVGGPTAYSTASVSIVSTGTMYCGGVAYADTFTATPVNGGTPTYQWYKNGSAISGATASSYITTSLANNDSIWVMMYSGLSCSRVSPVYSNHIHVSIGSGSTVVPTIAVSARIPVLCSSSTDTFTAATTFGGTVPHYQWYKDGVAVGTNSSLYVATGLINNDSVWCVLTSNMACASPSSVTSNHVTIAVTSTTITPSVNITSTAASYCGTSAPDTFTVVSTTFGGLAPAYQWYLNGTSLGTNSTKAIAYSLNNNDSVWCVMTSSVSCASPASVASNKIHILVHPILPTAVTVTASHAVYCGAVSADTFTAVATDPGLTPVYQWYRNDTAVGTNSTTYITSTLSNNSDVWVTMASSIICPSASPAISNFINVQVSSPAPTAPVLSLTGGSCLGSNTLILGGASAASGISWMLNGTNIFSASSTLQSTIIAGGNGYGSGLNQMESIGKLYVNATGYSYLPDMSFNRITRFPPGSTSATNGTIVAGTGTAGSGAAQLNTPYGVCFDAAGNLYVADRGNNRVQKFPPGSISGTAGVTVAGGNGYGNAANQIYPSSICVDAAGNLYVLDNGARVQKFPAGSTSATNGVTVAGTGVAGSQPNQLSGASDMQMDPIGNIYVADYNNNRIQKFPAGSTAGTNAVTVAGGNGQGSAYNQLYNPVSVSLDRAGNIYVSDYANYRIMKFPANSTSATYGTIFYTAGAYTGDIFVDANNILYEGNVYNYDVQKFSYGVIDTMYPPSSAGSYTANYVTTSGCTSPVSNAIVINSAGPTSVTIAASQTSICSSAADTFTATPTNGGTTPSYQWYKDGVAVGTNSVTYITSTLANNDSIWCIITSNSPCASPSTGTSNKITVTVNGSSVTPGVSITAAHTTFCGTLTDTFTATPTNGGTAPSYQWYKDGVAVGTNSATFITAALANNDSVWCVMTSNAACASPLTATSGKVHITITTSVTPGVSITATQTTFCGASTDTFTATPTNGGTAPSYQWYKDGVAAGTNSATFITAALANNDSVWCVMTSNAACASPLTASSGKVHIMITTSVTPAVSITAAQSTFCGTLTDTFTATPTNGGTAPSYQWYKDGVAVGTNSATFITAVLANNDSVWCVMTSNAACASPLTASSGKVHITITTSVTPGVSITATQSTFCGALTDTFTATPTNGGTAPSYQWYKDGVAVGTNSATFITATLANNDSVWCVMTSNAACASPLTATSTKVHITISSTLTPGVSITAARTTFCGVLTDTFTATPTNGGTAPSYQWYKDGAAVGTNSATFITAALANNDSIWCVMTSNSPCASPLTATSGKVHITISSSLTPSVSITAAHTTFCGALTDTFTATPTNGGIVPSYQWYKDGVAVGTNSATFITAALANNDSIWCVMTSNAACASPLTATSGKVHITITASVTPTVSITATHTTFCGALTDTFTATPTNGGTAPSYQWYKDGVAVGTNAATFITAALANNDSIWCVMTSNAACASPLTATSGKVHVTITTSVTPAVSITAAHTTFCGALTDTFTATPTNGGTAPSYQWYKDGVAVGTNSATFITAALANNDSVWCVMTSNAACASPLTATSSHIRIAVPTPIVITGLVTCVGTNTANGVITLTVTGGNPAYTYNWGAGITTQNRSNLASGTYTVTVTDAGGCTASKSFVLVSLAGRVYFWDFNRGVYRTVLAEGTNSELTDTSGKYSFMVPQGSTDFITPSKNNDSVRANGVTVLDALKVQRYIAGTYLLTGPYQLIAADVDGSGSITTNDYNLIEALILGNTTTFPGNKLWNFVPSNYVFTNPSVPWGFPTSRNYTSTTTQTNQSGQDFIGIKLGDVDGTWNPLIAKVSSASDTVMAYIPNAVVNQGAQSVLIPVKARNFNAISGFQFTLGWDSTKLTFTSVDTTAGYVQVGYGTTLASSGLLSVIWLNPNGTSTTVPDDSTLFYVRFNVTAHEGDTILIRFDSVPTAIQFIDSNLNILTPVLKNGDLYVTYPTGIATEPVTEISIYPNPASSEVIINISGIQTAKTEVRITDVSGRTVFTGDTDKTSESISVSTWAEGLYMVQVSCGDKIKNVKLVVLHP